MRGWYSFGFYPSFHVPLVLRQHLACLAYFNLVVWPKPQFTQDHDVMEYMNSFDSYCRGFFLHGPSFYKCWGDCGNRWLKYTETGHLSDSEEPFVQWMSSGEDICVAWVSSHVPWTHSEWPFHRLSFVTKVLIFLGTDYTSVYMYQDLSPFMWYVSGPFPFYENYTGFLHFCPPGGGFPLTTVFQGHPWVGLQYIIQSLLTCFIILCKPSGEQAVFPLLSSLFWGLPVKHSCGSRWHGEVVGVSTMGVWATCCTICSYLQSDLIYTISIWQWNSDVYFQFYGLADHIAFSSWWAICAT